MYQEENGKSMSIAVSIGNSGVTIGPGENGFNGEPSTGRLQPLIFALLTVLPALTGVAGILHFTHDLSISYALIASLSPIIITEFIKMIQNTDTLQDPALIDLLKASVLGQGFSLSALLFTFVTKGAGTIAESLLK